MDESIVKCIHNEVHIIQVYSRVMQVYTNTIEDTVFNKEIQIFSNSNISYPSPSPSLSEISLESKSFSKIYCITQKLI